MKKKLLISLAILSIIIFNRCEKEKDNNSTKISFVAGENYITSDKTAEIGDTLIFIWNMESVTGMQRLYIEDNTAATATVYTFKSMTNVFFTDSIIEIPANNQY